MTELMGELSAAERAVIVEGIDNFRQMMEKPWRYPQLEAPIKVFTAAAKEDDAAIASRAKFLMSVMAACLFKPEYLNERIDAFFDAKSAADQSDETRTLFAHALEALKNDPQQPMRALALAALNNGPSRPRRKVRLAAYNADFRSAGTGA